MTEVLTCRSGPEGRVAEIVLNRPARRNALTAATAADLRAALATASAAPDVSVILLRGAGGCFCSGIDLTELPRDAETTRRWSATWAGVHDLLARTDVPVVAVLERAAVNAGAALALAADLLVVGAGAFLQVQEVRRGMVPWANAGWLTARFGAARALDLMLTGRRLDGPELHRLGMAHTVAPDAEVLDQARDLASTLTGHSRRAVATTKALVRGVGGLGVPAALDAAFAAAALDTTASDGSN